MTEPPCAVFFATESRVSRFLYRLGRLAVRRRWRVLGAWLLLLLGFALLGSLLGGHPADDFTIPGTETQRASDLLTQRFPSESGATARIVVSVDHGTLGDPSVEAGIARMLATARSQPRVVAVSPIVTPQMLGLSPNPRISLATV
jgi:putative drug exporter of the RND superfamily